MSSVISPGNLVWAGFEGTTVPEYMKNHLKNGNLGGIVLFSRNFTTALSLRNLTDELRSLWNGEGVLPIAIDQEGGRVRRLSWVNWPSAYSMSTIEDSNDIFHIGAAMAEELLTLGMNVDFAPVLDLHNPASKVLGDRCFSQDEKLVVEKAEAWIDGAKSTGLSVCGKHFPGHGCVHQDSHEEKPVCDLPFSDMQSHLYPFERLHSKLDIIMVAHVLYRGLDSDRVATFSSKILSLPAQWGYEGILMSDDLEMGALREFDAGEIAFRSLKSGMESLIICRSETMLSKVISALNSVFESNSDTSEKLMKLTEKVVKWRGRLTESYRDFSTENYTNMISDNNFMLEKLLS
ncbi:MAG: beta-N-acetylhexosaminidase [Deltaproteobacteria bacterium]|nr:beta-N-acetylhexosaminidase [Deltaproteobacteria bacterium]